MHLNPLILNCLNSSLRHLTLAKGIWFQPCIAWTATQQSCLMSPLRWPLTSSSSAAPPARLDCRNWEPQRIISSCHNLLVVVSALAVLVSIATLQMRVWSEWMWGIIDCSVCPFPTRCCTLWGKREHKKKHFCFILKVSENIFRIFILISTYTFNLRTSPLMYYMNLYLQYRVKWTIVWLNIHSPFSVIVQPWGRVDEFIIALVTHSNKNLLCVSTSGGPAID